MPSPNVTGHTNVTYGTSRIRVIRGGGFRIQQRHADQEAFAAILVQLRILEGRATAEEADFMQRNLRQVAARLDGKV